MKSITKMLTLFFVIFAILTACNDKFNKTEEDLPKTETKVEIKEDTIPTIKETFLSKWDDKDNVDSPAFYVTPQGENWVIATGKVSNDLLIYNAENGELIKRVLKSGAKAGELNRPNGIWVVDDICAIVERDNHRVQVLSLPDFKHLGFIANDKLIKPYGLSIDKLNDSYRLFITDNYEKNDSIPPNEELGKRVLEYTFTVKNGKLKSEFKRYIGDTSGDGVLKIVESVYADPTNNTLLLSEEDETLTYLKSYNLTNGTFDGRTLGKGIMKYQAEGIAKNMINGSISYDTKDFTVRLSVNHTSDYVDEFGDEAFEDRYYDKQTFVDMNASYALTDQFRIYAEANNLTNQPLRYYQGVSGRTMQAEYYNMRFNFGVKFDL